MSGAQENRKSDVCNRTEMHTHEGLMTESHKKVKTITAFSPISSAIDVTASITLSRNNPNNLSLSDKDDNSENAKVQHFIFHRDKINLEPHQLVWLDIRENSNEIDIDGLRQIIDYTKFFHNISECLTYIKQAKDTIIFFVYIDELRETSASMLDSLDNIYACYVYCQTNPEYYQQHAMGQTKFKQCIHTELSQLLGELTNDVQEYLRHKQGIGEILFSDVIERKQDNSTDNAVFSWWKYFIQMLCHLKYPKHCKQEQLISSLQVYYQGNKTVLKILDEFKANYSPENAIQWYTRPIFLSCLLNHALRLHHIELMFMFGFLLHDLNQQLRQAHTDFISTQLHTSNPVVKAYRGQVMSCEEIELLYEDNQVTSQRIVINSLFSTSYDRLVALHFLPEPEQLKEQLKRVLFEVTIDTHQQRTHPFSDVSQLSAIPDESEILFMTGTHFYIDANSIKYDELEKIWIVKLKLAEDFHMKQEKDFIYSSNDDKKTLKNCIAILLDNIRHALPEQLDKIFDGLLHIYPLDAKWLSAMKFHCLAKYYQYPERMAYTEALCNYNKALALWSECINDHNDKLNHAIDIGKLHKDLAWFYQDSMNNNQLADSHYDLSIEFNQLAHASTATSASEHIDLLHRLSDIYENKMELINSELLQEQNYGLLAIKFKQEEVEARKNRNDCTDHDQIIISIGQIAHLYKAINKYDDALFWYEKAVEIELREEPICYYSINDIYEEIIQIYTDRQNPVDHQLVLKYRLMIDENILKMNHDSSEFNDSDNNEKMKIARSHI